MSKTRLRLVVAGAWLLFWVLMIVTALQDFLRNDTGPLWHPLLWEGSSAVVGTAMLVVQRVLSRRFDPLVAQPRQWFLRQLPWLLFWWVCFVPLAFGIRHGVYALMGETYPHAPWPSVFVYENVKISIYFAIFTVITFGIVAWQAMQAERLRLARMETELRTAQLNQLTQQMHPHFLFNALNTIASVMHDDVDRADALVVRLSDMLRAALAAGERQQVPLATELDLLRGYAELMAERFADRVTIAWHVADGLDTCAVPAMSVQPLLENVFRHTVERRSGPVRIAIHAARDGNVLRLAVEDDAGRLDPDAPSAGAGVGLANLRERLRALHGDAATLTLTQNAPAGVRSELVLPCAC